MCVFVDNVHVETETDLSGAVEAGKVTHSCLSYIDIQFQVHIRHHCGCVSLCDSDCSGAIESARFLYIRDSFLDVFLHKMS